MCLTLGGGLNSSLCTEHVQNKNRLQGGHGPQGASGLAAKIGQEEEAKQTRTKQHPKILNICKLVNSYIHAMDHVQPFKVIEDLRLRCALVISG